MSLKGGKLPSAFAFGAAETAVRLWARIGRWRIGGFPPSKWRSGRSLAHFVEGLCVRSSIPAFEEEFRRVFTADGWLALN